MTDEEIHNIYLHMSGKAEGLFEATGTADFPVLFARAILEYEGMTKDVQNIASKSTYKEQLETKDEPVAWMNRHGACKTSLFMEVEAGAKEEYTIPVYTQPQRTGVGLTELDCVGWFGYDTGLRLWFEADKNDDGAIPLYKNALEMANRALETKDATVQVSPLEFVEMVMEKEHLIGQPIFWAQWPNEEKK